MDPILMTVITNRLEGVTREMGAGMLRSSRSPIFAENKDFVTAVFDHQLRLVAQTAYIPVLMGASPFAVKAISDHFGDDVEPGDVMILNDPYRGNNHAPDISVMKPVFFAGELRFWVLSRGHHADIGGGGAAGRNPHAATAWEEGLRIPPAKLYRGGAYNRDVWEIILLNVRLRNSVEGDLQCQVGACNVGEKALEQMLERYGCDRVDGAIEEVLDRSEVQMRERIAAVPDGVYHASRQLDHVLEDGPGGRPAIRVRLEVKGDTLRCDFAGSDAQIPVYYNSSYANTVSSCYIGLFSTIAADVSVNEGCMRPVEVSAPEGSLVNPREGAPTTQCTVATCATIVEAVWMALSQAVPERVQAGLGAHQRGRRHRPEPADRPKPAAFILHFAKGGGGATQGFDGWNHISPVSSMGGSRVPDPELYELTFPHRILKYELPAGQRRRGQVARRLRRAVLPALQRRRHRAFGPDRQRRGRDDAVRAGRRRARLPPGRCGCARRTAGRWSFTGPPCITHAAATWRKSIPPAAADTATRTSGRWRPSWKMWPPSCCRRTTRACSTVWWWTRTRAPRIWTRPGGCGKLPARTPRRAGP